MTCHMLVSHSENLHRLLQPAGNEALRDSSDKPNVICHCAETPGVGSLKGNEADSEVSLPVCRLCQH